MKKRALYTRERSQGNERGEQEMIRFILTVHGGKRGCVERESTLNKGNVDLFSTVMLQEALISL